MRVFLDTSAYVKRFVEEAGSNTVIALCQNAQEIALCIVSVTEILSTMNRLRREKKLADHPYALLKKAIMDEIIDIPLCGITQQVIEQSILLLESNALKTLDAIQIACALTWHADLFVSSDKQQVNAAKNSGLSVLVV